MKTLLELIALILIALIFYNSIIAIVDYKMKPLKSHVDEMDERIKDLEKSCIDNKYYNQEQSIIVEEHSKKIDELLDVMKGY